MFLSSLFANIEKAPGPTDNFWYNPVSGYSMSAEEVMRISAVYACVAVISETAGMLPFILYKRLDKGGKERAKEHPLSNILRLKPNKFQTAIQFISMMTGDAVLRGCAYAEIIQGRRSFVGELKRLHPDCVTPEVLAGDKLRFKISNQDGTHRYLTQDEVFILAGKFSDGISKVNAPITLMAQINAIASQQEAHNKSQLDNGIRLSGILSTDQAIKEDIGQKVIKSWQEMFKGAKNSNKVALLPSGLKFQQMSMTNEDAQFIEGMQFTNKQIARFFRVPPHKIGILDDATFSNIEQQSIEFITDTMMPWLKRWEQAVSTQLLLEKEQEMYFAEFLVDAIMRGDSTARAAYYNTMVTIGAMDRNEVREKENMNPREGLDEPLQPLNMAPAGTPPDKQQPPKKEPFMQPKRKKNDKQDAGRVDSAFEKLFASIAGRVVRAETGAVSRIVSKNNLDKEKLSAWAEEFYSKHSAFIVQAFEGATTAYGQLSEKTIDLQGLADSYCNARKEQLKNGIWEENESEMASALVDLVKSGKGW